MLQRGSDVPPLRIQQQFARRFLRNASLLICAFFLLFGPIALLFKQFSSSANAAEAITITSVTPDSGPTAGGTTVTINGSNFQNDKIKKVSAGGEHTCILTLSGKAYCWGLNSSGQLGNGTTTDSAIPVAVSTNNMANDSAFANISAKGDTTCGITTAGKAYCWGNNSNGQLGDGTTTQRTTPVAVSTSGVLSGKTIISLSVGANKSPLGLVGTSTCALTNEGKIYCWGYNGYGGLGDGTTTQRTTPVAVSTSGVLSGKTVDAISNGGGHACAIDSDKSLYCWGYNGYGQLGNNSTATSSVPVKISVASKQITSVSAGGINTCALTTDAQPYCWGNNYYGQVGDNTTTNRLVPTAITTSGVLSGKTVTAISTGGSFYPSIYYYDTSCALTSDGKAYCWGYNGNGQLGDASGTNKAAPVAVDTSGVLNGKTLTSINQGSAHICTLADTNSVHCWGYNSKKQLGDNSGPTSSSVPVTANTSNVAYESTIVLFDNIPSPHVTYISPIQLTAVTPAHATGFVDITATNPDNGTATASSAFYYGQHPPAISTVTPESGLPNGGTTVTITGNNFNATTKNAVVSAGGVQSCALIFETPFCWGSNNGGQLGDGTTTQRNTPVAVNTSGALNGKKITKLFSGSGTSCAIADGKAYCWGWNDQGQVGDGTTTNRSSPVAVDTSGVLNGKIVTDISVGTNSTCAIADSKAYCWGYNTTGALGNNSTTNSSVPVAVDTSGVLNGKTVTKITAGGGSTCAIADGKAYCWGGNSSGQLGDGTTTQRNTPVAVDTSGVLNGKTVTKITLDTDAIPGFQGVSEYGGSACAIASGWVYCWGNNNSGQLGDGTTTQRTAPVAVNGSGSVTDVDVGFVITGSWIKYDPYGHTCAISNNKPYCWGNNAGGQLGDGTTTQRTAPVAVNTSGVLYDKTIKSISVGGFGSNSTGMHSCVSTTDDNLYCWGGNGNGQIGDDSTTQRTTPVAVNQSAWSSIAPTLPIVKFDDIVAPNVILVSQTQLTVTTPINSVGAKNITVINPDGKSTMKAGAFTYNYSQPTITSVAPSSGTVLGGTVATITGAGFNNTLHFSKIAGGSSHTCGIADGKAYCWGNNNRGQLGDGTTTKRYTPVAVDTTGVLDGKTVTDIDTQEEFTCAIASGKPYCWGANGYQNLGNSTSSDSSVPVAVDVSGYLANKTITSISVGSYTACAVADGKVYCWGNNGDYNIGDGTTTNRATPYPVSVSGALANKTITDVNVGWKHTCAIADGKAYCWGDNGDGQLGDGTTTNRYTPVAVTTDSALGNNIVTKISSGDLSTCAIAGGKAYCWGNNSNGELGDGTTNNRNSPTAVYTGGVLSGKTVTDVDIYANQGCAIANSKAYCWGRGENGDLGDDNWNSSNNPVAVKTTIMNGSTTHITAGYDHTCAINDGKAYCWGQSYDGQVGYAPYEDHGDYAVGTPTPPLYTLFTQHPTFLLGGVPATNISYINSTTITATTPAHTSGLVDSTLINPDGQMATLANSYTYLAAPPSEPTSLTTTPDDAAVRLNWQTPISDGGAAIDDYKIEYSSDNGNTWQVFNHPPSTATTRVVTGLSPAVTYAFRVSAINSVGTSNPSNEALGTPVYITLDTNGSITIDIIPQGSTTISSNDHVLTLDTNSPSGFHVTLEMINTTRNLVNNTSTISPSGGTLASPTALLVNTWGYRIDGAGGFGNGPTVAETNTPTSGYTWAGVPANGAPETIKSSALPATNDQTTIWYGLNASNIKPSGQYTGTVLYTAIAN